jgi:acetylornithine deacetylase/succinyl-diaminopimelate desuccinylase-like protein
VATLHNEAGEVTLDGSGPATSFNVEIDRDDLRKSATVVDSLTEIGSGTLADRLWAGVSVSVIGMDTVSIEEASNTLIPSARAKVSIRIPPGTTPTKILDSLENHCQTHVPWGAEVQVIRGAEANPAMVDTGGPLVQAGMKAYKHAFGVDPVFIGQGGAIPLVNELMKAFPQAEFLITAIADPGSHMHGPNESVSFMDLCRTVSAQVALMEEYCVVKSG